MPNALLQKPVEAGDLPSSGKNIVNEKVVVQEVVASGRPSLLLLDDDPFIAVTHSLMLRAMGYATVRVADSAASALDVLQREKVDVVICDLNMPGMDGIEFLQVLKSRPEPPNVILLSGHGSRTMQTVAKVFAGSPLTVLGAIEKPAERAAMQLLLDGWRAPDDATPIGPPIVIRAEEFDAAFARQQWTLQYQPKVDLRSCRLTGVEALVRWNHPLHGLLYPDRFIALAEDSGAIDRLTDWVLAEAVRQLALWQCAGYSMTMAVNLSMDNLAAKDFASRLTRTVDQAGVEARDLVLEVTESRLMSRSLEPLETLARLRMREFGLSIDDFGTGHSSLAQLRDVPFTELKVDRGFVRNARHDRVLRPILEGSLGMASRLGMRSVGEGVETLDDWNLLRELGCDVAQGYFIGRPMAAGRLPAWLDDWNTRAAALAAP